MQILNQILNGQRLNSGLIAKVPMCNQRLLRVKVCQLIFHRTKYASGFVSLQGVNVREKAKQLVTLLKDEERLREERIHALKTKEKMAQTSSGKT